MATIPTTASAIAAAIASRQITAREVIDSYLATIESRESDIHAFNLVTADAARAQADRGCRCGVV
mgnify:CR=1 FL=1